ncbi:MAG TPA: NAD(P)H-hydrate dehydratase [Sphingomicrobium sp.]|nr:NAD(P)H-hydrate dehydratase [Sphingomicrobium sp.]
MIETELTRAALRDFPLPAQADTDKDFHGQLLIVAGSENTPGAAVLCATAAMRAGVGQIRLATAAAAAMHVAMQVPELWVIGVDRSKPLLDQLRDGIEAADAIVAGPGIIDEDFGKELATHLLCCSVPVVFDVGLLYRLEALEDECREFDHGPILLPNARELATLLGCSREQVDADRLAAGRAAAERYNSLVLAKGAVSHVVAPDGRAWTFRGGAPGLGVAGSGDTLAGIVGALLARGAEPLTALLWGVLLHGEAGEMLSAKVRPVGFLAREIPAEIPALLAR